MKNLTSRLIAKTRMKCHGSNFISAIAALAGLLSIFSTNQAHADSVQQSVTHTLPVGIYTQFTFDAFNTSLGTLTGATLDFSGSLQGSFSVGNTSSNTEYYDQVSAGWSVTDGVQTYNTGFNPAATSPGFAISPGTTLTLSFSPGQSATTLDAMNFANEIANFGFPNGTSPFTLDALYAVSPSTGGAGTPTIDTSNTTSPVTLTLNYTYTATPEPSSWALAVIALSAAVYSRRRALRA